MELEEKIREVIEPMPDEIVIPKRGYRRHRRRVAIKKRRTIIYDVHRGGYYPSIGYYRWDGNHVKLPKDSHIQRYLKKWAHKAVRRYTGDLGNGNMGNKLFDYTWYFF